LPSSSVGPWRGIADPRRSQHDVSEVSVIEQYVVGLDQVGETQVAIVGGKGAHLGALARIDGIREAIRVLSAQVRETVEGIVMPGDLAAAITHAVVRLGGQAAYAVRSSATAEDLPTASFAGQQDTYLNVVGEAAIRRHVSRCWASLSPSGP
jgi:phosphoenolpyruvate synthase/pyruvate phosphate dikinase